MFTILSQLTLEQIDDSLMPYGQIAKLPLRQFVVFSKVTESEQQTGRKNISVKYL